MITKTGNTIIKKRIIQIVSIILLLMAAVSVVQGIINGINSSVDFLYDNFVEALTEHSYSDCQFPFTFWGMFFFGFLPEMPARILWIACNIVFTVIIAWTLRKTFFRDMDPDIYRILILMMISGGAWRTNLSNGQYNLAAFAFFMLAVYFSEQDRDGLAGIFLSMCIFKYQFTGLMAVYFLYKRKYKTIGVATGILLVSLLGTSIWFGGLYNVTLKQLFESQGRGLGSSGDVDIESIFGLGDHIILFFLIGVLFLICLAYYKKWRRDDLLFICISLFTAWACAYQRIYSFFPLIIPLGYSWERIRSEGRLFYKIEFLFVLLLTAAFFWSRTISDSLGLLLERILFYPTFALMIIDIGIGNKAFTEDSYLVQ